MEAQELQKSRHHGAPHAVTPGRQLLQLAAVATSTGVAERKFRSLRLSGVLLALSGLASVALVTALGAPDTADIVALRIMAYACWLYGGLGLWALLSPAALSETPSTMGRLRGHCLDSTSIQLLGFFRRLFLGMCLAATPGLLAAIVVSPNVPVLVQRGALLVAAIVYLCTLSFVLAALGVFSVRTVPRAPRSFALAVVLVPFALSFVAGQIPSIPGVYSWALGQMIDWGGLG